MSICSCASQSDWWFSKGTRAVSSDVKPVTTSSYSASVQVCRSSSAEGIETQTAFKICVTQCVTFRIRGRAADVVDACELPVASTVTTVTTMARLVMLRIWLRIRLSQWFFVLANEGDSPARGFEINRCKVLTCSTHPQTTGLKCWRTLRGAHAYLDSRTELLV